MVTVDVFPLKTHYRAFILPHVAMLKVLSWLQCRFWASTSNSTNLPTARDGNEQWLVPPASLCFRGKAAVSYWRPWYSSAFPSTEQGG